jgi:hypothetical protein
VSSRIINVVVLLFLGIQVAAQQSGPAATQQSAPAKTKLETFAAQTGVVIIEGYSKVGTIRGKYGTVEIQAKEFVNAASGKKEKGITFEVTEAGRLERESRSFIDYDEIDSLLKGIDYVAKIDKSATKLDAFEAEYRTKGELEITTFSSDTGVEVAVKSGRIGGATAFLSLEHLQRLRALVVDAKTTLDAL